MRSVCRGALPTPEVSISVYQCECELYIYMRHVFINMYYGIKWKVKTADKIVRIVSLVWFAQIKTVTFFVGARERMKNACACVNHGIRLSVECVVKWSEETFRLYDPKICVVCARGGKEVIIYCVCSPHHIKSEATAQCSITMRI